MGTFAEWSAELDGAEKPGKAAKQQRGQFAQWADDVDAPPPSPPPAVPPKRDDYATSTATTPGEQRKADITKEKEKLRAGLFADSVEAAGYGAARGATLGAVDRLVGIGTQAGESLASATGGLQENPNAGEEARQSYLADEARVSAGPVNETAHLIGEMVGGAIPATALAGAAPVARMVPTGMLPRAAAVLGQPAVKMAAQNAAAGALNQPSNDLPATMKAGAGGALLGHAAGGIANKTIGKMFSGSVDREARGLIRDIMQSESGASATPTARKQLVQKLDAAVKELRGDPMLAQAARSDTAGAQRLVQAKIDRVTEPREMLYADLDSRHAPLTVADLHSGAFRSAKSAKNPKEREVLQKFADELDSFWIPKWESEGMLTKQVGKPMAVNSLAVREWVTQAQNAAADAMGTIDPTRAKKIQEAMADTATGIWQRHLDSARSSAADTVAAIRIHDARFSALKAMDKVLGQRLAKEQEQKIGIGKKLSNAMMAGELGLAATAASLGHPVKALLGLTGVEAAKLAASSAPKALRALNDKWIVPIEEAARRGTPWAEVVKFAAASGIPQGVARAAYDRGAEGVRSLTGGAR